MSQLHKIRLGSTDVHYIKDDRGNYIVILGREEHLVKQTAWQAFSTALETGRALEQALRDFGSLKETVLGGLKAKS